MFPFYNTSAKICAANCMCNTLWKVFFGRPEVEFLGTEEGVSTEKIQSPYGIGRKIASISRYKENEER
jgi:hypothetical protein